MGEGLRKVAEEVMARGVNLLGVEGDVVCMAEQRLDSLTARSSSTPVPRAGPG
jgi:hypothetical protein